MSDRKKGGGLDYIPQAFPGARAPDGPAPDLQARLAQMGLAEQTATPTVRSDARQDISTAPAKAAEPQARLSPSTSAPVESSRRIATPPPMPEPPRRTERAVAPEPAPRRTERAAPSSAPATPQPQPVYVVPPPASATVAAPPPSTAAAPTLPPVPKEAEPRPLPVATTSSALTLNRDTKAVTKPATQRIRKAERLRALPDKEDRVRISLRLVPSVDQKLDDLAHLRGLDRNTAISVAIAQDWIACFGLQARQVAR
ncbi:MAG TPA: hypothetical protein PKE31_21605 [Pseudomonadota bacterium]|nr:hypothetical protein [Pseudomonadota bacterium]